ncbi:MAG: nickel pincer cofactor biosynthesis protein LarC [Planctomycetota bacterium]
MRIGYLDCFSGVAGDMWVGALLDLGVPLGALAAAVDSLGLPGVSIRDEPVRRASLAARKFHVDVARPSAGARHLADIRELLARADLPDRVRADCDAVFLAIAEAEARQHGCAVEEVHFHEVGAEDTIADVVCACLGTHLLGIERLYASAVEPGSGTVDCEHGRLPVPAPGTLDLLFGIPLRSRGLRGERTTPTGAALLRVLVDGFEPDLLWTPLARGHGAGTRDDEGHPNVLRLIVGEEGAGRGRESIEELQCQVDTASGELLSWLLGEALRRGAKDAFVAPIAMKKGRPGHLVTIHCAPADADGFERFLLEESTSLGVRRLRVDRSVVERWEEVRQTPLGAVRFKVSRLPSGRLRARPEDDEVRRLCEQHGLSRSDALSRLESATEGDAPR